MKKLLITVVVIIITSILLLFVIYQIKIQGYKNECTFTDKQGKIQTVEYLQFDGCNTTSCTKAGLITTEKYCTTIGKFLDLF